jgi:glycolate oxidase
VSSLSKELSKLIGKENTFNGAEDRFCYSYDGTFLEGYPEVIVKPRSTEQVSLIMNFAAENGISVFPRGAGTGLSGGSIPKGGIALVTTSMNAIKEISKQDTLAVVEPGIVTAKIHKAVEDIGLFYPPDPASSDFCTMGGNIAECAGGPRGIKYGVTRDYLLGLEVVLPNGDVLKTGGRTIKNVTGYDFTRLIAGSEGTLAIITEATVKLIPNPESIQTILAVFDDLLASGEAVQGIIGEGVIPRTLEIMDKTAIEVVENFAPTGLPVNAAAILLIETDGVWEAAQKEAKIVSRICKECGAIKVKLAKDEAEAALLWKARKSVSPAIVQISPTKISEDVTVPRSRIVEMIGHLNKIKKKHKINLVIFGHAGDGNLHPNIATDKNNKEEMKRVDAAIDEIFEVALDLGGTLSGEHGIGILKSKYLKNEIGEVGLDLSKRLKGTFDAKMLLNPGKQDNVRLLTFNLFGVIVG